MLHVCACRKRRGSQDHDLGDVLSSSWPAGVRRWTPEELSRDAAAGRADFRARRLGEPRARYLAAFDAASPVLVQLVEKLELALAPGPGGAELLADLCKSDLGRTAFRYLGAPPISTDDLETLAEVRFAAAAFDAGGATADRLLDVMRAIVDPRRFPWLDERRPASATEHEAARLATAALMASQRVQALRRGDEKAAVEGAVKGLLVGMGWRPAEQRPAQGIQRLLMDSPPPRSFLTQCNLGADNADLIVRLDDDRLLAIECKGSNSEINSRKRLNKEAAQNARAWTGRFGSQIVAAVALQGVFKARYLEEAQDTPMAIYWSHRLEDLKDFVANALRG